MVLELRPKHPSNSVCVVECDLELDFAPPLDYVEPPKDYGRGAVAPTSSDAAPLPTKVRYFPSLSNPSPFLLCRRLVFARSH